MQKVFTIFLLAAMMCVLVCGCSNAPASLEPTPTAIKAEVENAGVAPTMLETAMQETDYMALMVASCLNGDFETGRRAEADRNAKIAALNLDVPEISFDELYELSKVITNEAGSDWLPMEWKMRVGEVVVNRVASVEFPDTIYEVIHQKDQYSNANTSYFENLVPYKDCVDAAIRLLNGERLINDASVVFQSNHREGSGTYLEMYDSRLGYTYLCYSNYPELY